MCQCCSSHQHIHTEVLKVEGMTCGHCVAAVEKAVMDLNGVSEVKVNLEQKEVKVVYDADLVTVDAIKNAIIEEGYTIN